MKHAEHKMPGGKMMSDSEMEKAHGGKMPPKPPMHGKPAPKKK